MDLQKTLRSLKSIEPRSEYTLRSKAQILNTEPRALPWYHTMPTLVRQAFNSPRAVLAAVVLAIIGSFGFTHFFTATPTAVIGSLDTRALEAEAQAVDIQIQLANVQYQTLAEQGVVPAKPVATNTKNAQSGTAPVSSGTKASASSTDSAPTFQGAIASATTSSNTAIEKALRELTQ